MKLKSLTRSSSPILPPLMNWRVWQTRSWSPILPPLKKLKSLTDTFFHQYHQYSLHWRSWRVWQTRSSSPILPPLMKLKRLTDTFLITNTASTEETEEFDRHVLHHQYSLRWRSCKIWQTRSSSPILHPIKKLESLTDIFLITNTPSIEEAEEFDRHFLDHQYSLH